ncbi:hypothetical protein P7C70_g4582, partial [Phenoliferia sp. Uapishka_3]
MSATQVKMRLMQVTPDVFLAEPIHPGDPEVLPPHPPAQPELVILFGWMGAAHGPLQKYTDAYRLLFPAASIMLIRSHPKAFLRTASHARAALRPAHALLAARYHSVAPGPNSPILVHTMSNGGAIQLMHLNELFVEAAAKAKVAKKEGTPLLEPVVAPGPDCVPARAFVFDSCPGGLTLQTTIAAFTAPLKSAWTRVPASIVLGGAYYFFRFISLITGQPSSIDKMRNYLATSLPPVPRLYIYSAEDKLVPIADVQKQISEVRAAGVEVSEERFEGTNHVAHLRGGPERYWAAVKSLWEGKTA